MKIHFEIDIPKNNKWLTRIALDEYRRTLRRAAEGQLKTLGRQYVIADKIASGKTFDSFQISDIKTLGDRMEIETAPTGDRASMVAGVIEYGADYDKPMGSTAIDNIMDWMRVRGIGAGLKDKDFRRLAFAIAGGVRQYGLEPHYLMEKSENQYRRHIIRMFEAATRRIVRRFNSKHSTTAIVTNDG